jgi:hypothetical protein
MYELWYQLLFDNVMAWSPGLSHYNSYICGFSLLGKSGSFQGHCSHHCEAPRSALSNSSSGSLHWVTHTYLIQGIPNNLIACTLYSPTHSWNINDHKIDSRQETTINTNSLFNYCPHSRLHLISLFYSSGYMQLILENDLPRSTNSGVHQS